MTLPKAPLEILSSAVAGCLGAYYGQPYVSNDSDIVIIVVTVFSVFTGFLIAAIAIIGDPRMIHEDACASGEINLL
jgi:hypothetical protein